MGGTTPLLRLHIAATLAFYLLGLAAMQSPPALFYDEAHYVRAAIQLARDGIWVNREHPMLAKEILALGWWIGRENLAIYRLIALSSATLGFFFACRAMWWHSQDRAASIAFPIFLVSGALLLGLGRLAQLEAFLFAFSALTLFLFAKGHARSAAVAMGLAVACKWATAPLAILLFGVYLLRRDWRRAIEFFVLSAFTYFCTFIPAFLAREHPITPLDLPALHLVMREALSILAGIPRYESSWWNWLYGGGSVWADPDTIPILLNPVIAVASFVAILRFRDRFISLAGLGCFCLILLSGKDGLMIHLFLLPHAFFVAALSIEVARLSPAYQKAAWAIAIVSFVTLPVTASYHAGRADFGPTANAGIMKDCLDRPRECI